MSAREIRREGEAVTTDDGDGLWLLDQFGDGATCRCSTCPTILTAETLTVDPLRRGHLVRIRKGGKVYRVDIIATLRDEAVYLSADAKHPDAAKRVPDAFRWYAADSLIRVPA